MFSLPGRTPPTSPPRTCCRARSTSPGPASASLGSRLLLRHSYVTLDGTLVHAIQAELDEVVPHLVGGHHRDAPKLPVFLATSGIEVRKVGLGTTQRKSWSFLVCGRACGARLSTSKCSLFSSLSMKSALAMQK